MDDVSRKPGRTDGRRALAGIIILAVIVAGAALTITLDEIVASRDESVDLYAVLPEAKGLANGAAVWIAGNEVGEVMHVSLLPPGDAGGDRVVAVARIPHEHLIMLRSDSRARLASRGFVGDPVLELSPGSAGAAPLGAGDTVAAEFGPDRTARAIEAARAALGGVDSLLADLRAVGELYRARRPMIDRTTASVGLATAELDRTAAAFREGPLATTLTDARVMERVGAVRSSLATVQAGLARYTGGPMGTRLEGLAARADSLQAELALLDSLASDTGGFIGRVRADSALAVEAARAGAQLDSLAQDVRSNPFMFF